MAQNDPPAIVDPQVQQTKTTGKPNTRPGNKAPASRTLLNPTDAVAVAKLEEAQAAAKQKDFETAVRMAQKSYAAQNNLAAHYLAIKLRCQTGDQVNAPAEARKISASDLTPTLIAECQSRDIELKR
ncbi:hypothetical protein HI113_35780 [Corallococcus exiguus]|nr:hypothetical protein [Corallococcus exiguus]